jgi:hypothetical protein
MPHAKVYRIDYLKPKGYLSQIDDLSEAEQALLAEQKETSRQLFSLLLSEGDLRDEVAGRRRQEQERLLRERVRVLSQAVERIFAARGRQAYFDITGYTEQTLIQEARGQRPSGHVRRQCYLCEPMRTLGWSRRRALGEASLALYFEFHGSTLQGEVLAAVQRRWEERGLGPFELPQLAGPGFPLLAEVVREGLTTLLEGVLEPHLFLWQHSIGASWAIGGSDRGLVAESIARLLLRNTTPKSD